MSRRHGYLSGEEVTGPLETLEVITNTICLWYRKRWEIIEGNSSGEQDLYHGNLGH